MGSEYQRIIQLNRGQIQSGLSHDDIWSNVLDDCDDDEIEIVTEISNGVRTEPDIYNEVYKIESTGKTFCSNLTWNEKKLFLFLRDNEEDYHTAVETGWNCMFTGDQESINSNKDKWGE